MIDKFKIIGAVLLITLLLPIFLSGSIPRSIEEYFVILLVGIILILLVLFILFLNNSGKKSNVQKFEGTKVISSAHLSRSKIPLEDKKKYSTSTSTSIKDNLPKSTIQKKVSTVIRNTSNRTQVIKERNTLTIEQRYALLKVAIDFCYCSPERLYLWKGQYEILLEYTKTLKLDERQLDKCIQEFTDKFFIISEDNLKTKDYYKTIKAIYQDEPFIQLIKTCHKLLDFLGSLDEEIFKTEYYAYLVFPIILKDIGFTQEEIDNIEKGKQVYRFRKKDTEDTRIIDLPTLSTDSFPVSEEQMAIFKKNWTLLQFKKEFGTEKRIETRNYKGEDYKICIFIRASDNKRTEVGFSNSLGYPTIVEIQQREKELMVGLSEYGNYKLYDNKIVPFNSQLIDLGI